MLCTFFFFFFNSSCYIFLQILLCVSSTVYGLMNKMMKKPCIFYPLTEQYVLTANMSLGYIFMCPEEGKKDWRLRRRRDRQCKNKTQDAQRHEIGDQVDIQGSWDFLYIRVEDTEPTIKVIYQFSVYHSVIENLWCHFIQGHRT